MLDRASTSLWCPVCNPCTAQQRLLRRSRLSIVHDREVNWASGGQAALRSTDGYLTKLQGFREHHVLAVDMIGRDIMGGIRSAVAFCATSPRFIACPLIPCPPSLHAHARTDPDRSREIPCR